MKKMVMVMLAACMMFSGCALFREKLQDKALEAAKNAVVKAIYAKIDEREGMSDELKAVLKEISKNFIDKAFENMRNKYVNMKQEEVEQDLGELADLNLQAVVGSSKRLSAPLQ